MGSVLVCSNSACHFLLQVNNISKSITSLKSCPECRSGWSSRCPNCDARLGIRLQDGQPGRCTSCGKTIKPFQAAIGTARDGYSGAQAHAAD